MMSEQPYELQLTKDGSHTLFHKQLNETYHSFHGAYTESKHVFIEAGLGYASKCFTDIHLLEVGLGTGLNAILALEWTLKNERNIHYIGLEPFPLSEQIVAKLNYHQFFGQELLPHFNSLHQAPWEIPVVLVPGFTLTKKALGLEAYQDVEAGFNLVFYDAFAPKKQPDVWSVDNFAKIYTGLEAGGILVTYCASGQFKRDLQSVGFSVERIPGPPGKREMTRATKK